MIAELLWFGLGLMTLVAGAELLVRGASGLALSWGISPLVIGLTIVAMGTSSPEVAVSVGRHSVITFVVVLMRSRKAATLVPGRSDQ